VTPKFDYTASAELYFCRVLGRTQSMSYSHFDTAARAIEFAVEELGAVALRQISLEVDEQRFEQDEIRCLYDAVDYPPKRGNASA
jgi:hypothetical protein